MSCKIFIRVILGLFFTLGQSGCSNTHNPATEKQPFTIRETILVYTVNYPLQYFAQRIGGTHVEVHFPAPADADPAYWMPRLETIIKYQQADLILLSGAGYAQWVDLASLPKSKLCDTSAAFAEDLIALDDAPTHSHGPEGKHAHGGTAFTTWLDPTLAVKHASAVRASLTKLQPENAAAFQRNFDALKSDLEVLDREIAHIVGSASARPVVFSHPVYQYFARRYGLNGRSVHWEPDQPPTGAMWEELKVLLTEHPAKWMIWEGAPQEQTEKKLAGIGVFSATFAPSGNMPTEGDYLDVLRKNLDDLAKVYSDKPQPNQRDIRPSG